MRGPAGRGREHGALHLLARPTSRPAALMGLVAVSLALLAMPLATGQAVGQPAVMPPAGASYALTWQGALCPGERAGPASPAQSIDGKVDLCLYVPDVPGGTYHLAVVDYFTRLAGTTAPTTVPNGSSGASPAVSLSVEPGPVEPGQAITVTGVLRRPYKDRQDLVSFCWGGCPGGLLYGLVAVDWRSPTTFVAHLRVPAAPWAQTGPDEIVSPVAGVYDLGVQCVLLVPRCGLGPAEGVALVHLASRQDERFRGLTVELRAGDAELRLVPAPTFASLGHITPIGQYQAGEPPLSANPAAPSSVAWCAPGYVEVEGPPGRYKVPTAGATKLLRVDKAFAGVSRSWFTSCTMVAVQGPALFIGFSFPYVAVQYPQAPGAAALYSADGGSNWAFVPTPAGSSASGFEGFRYGAGGDVEALFGRSGEQGTAAFVPEVEQYSAATGRWSEALFSCPPAGPCVAWGASGAAPGCGMNPSYAQLLVSADEGAHWALLPSPVGLVQICMPATIIALSPTEALLLGADQAVSDYAGLLPVMFTQDGGRTWHVVSLPELPGQLTGVAAESLLGLPNGAILSVSVTPWELLLPGAEKWCTVNAMPSQAPGNYLEPSSFIVAGGSLWWLATSGSVPVADHVSVTSLGCGSNKMLPAGQEPLRRSTSISRFAGVNHYQGVRYVFEPAARRSARSGTEQRVGAS
ncbi:MAG: hypothetical protein M0005_16430 [Actinomycetota bacterium]|nr:hypothetical protein [Actinomycetota bacterium]